MNILVTAIGSFSADCVIGTLKNHGHKVVGCDIYPSIWHPISQECDAVYQAPYAIKEKDYIDFLLEISNKENIDYIFPLTDVEIDVINKNRSLFSERNIILCIQSENCLSIARDKSALTELFKQDTIVNVPLSVTSKDLSLEFPIPAIAKPINGRSSEGIVRVFDKEHLKDISEKENYIVQQFLDGSIYTVDYVRDECGNDYSVPREELLRTKNGAGTTVRIVPNQELQNTVSYIGKKIGVVGCVNMEFISHKDKFYLIDINPRFSAGVAFSNFIGYDMVTSHLNCFMGKSIQGNIDFNEQIIAKRYREEVLWSK